MTAWWLWRSGSGRNSPVLSVALDTEPFVGFEDRAGTIMLGRKRLVVPVVGGSRFSDPLIGDRDRERTRQRGRIRVGRLIVEPLPLCVEHVALDDVGVLADELA